MNYEQLNSLELDRENVFNTEKMTPALNVEEIIKNLPKTRYYGSKRRLLNWIYDSIKDLHFDTVLDAFGGTGSVSLLFKKLNKKVTFHDGLECNTVGARALLASSFPFDNIEEAHQFIDEITPVNGFISKTFDGMYFTEEENSWLDGAAEAIHKLSDINKRDVYLYCLFQACLKKRPFNLFHRANLNLRLNKNIKRSFGNHTTWETRFSEAMKAILVEVALTAQPCEKEAIVYSAGDVDLIDTKFDLVYLDPPYVNGAKVTDSYLRRYHFIEGLSIYPEWDKYLDHASPLKEIKQKKYINDWQNKKTFKERLIALIEKHRDSIVVLSYVALAYPSEEELTKIFMDNFKKVDIYRKEFSHALAKNRRTELLFIGSNK